jgi:uncharacterized protein YqeY
MNMTLEHLQVEMIKAMKEHNQIRKYAISSMIEAVKKSAIDKKCRDNIPESLIDEVLIKEKKTTQEMIDTCPANRQDLLEDYKAKMAVISEFAPTLLNDPAAIKQEILDSGIPVEKKNRGKMMALFKGRADMKVVNQVVMSLLAERD